MIKWICALVGFGIYRFSGAILGFMIGSFLEQLSNPNKKQRGAYTRNTQNQKVSPKDFELNLLSLSSLVIKADGNVTQKELDYVRQYFVQSYGKEHANATFRVFNDVIKKHEIDAFRIASYVAQHTRYESRLQILHFLFGIAKADGHVSDAEASKIQEISGYFKVNWRDFESIKAMFYQNADNAYKILEIEKTATDSEIKKAYRNMAKKYHPDKLQHLSEHLIKGAEEKFRAVQQAYEQLQKERGFK